MGFGASTFGDPGRGPLLTQWLDSFNASQSDVKVSALDERSFFNLGVNS